MLPLLAANLLLVACKDDYFDMTASNWILSGQTGVNGYLLNLKFDGDGTLLVKDANDEQYPFCENDNEDQLWDCEVEVDDGDTILHISYDEYTNDGNGNYVQQTHSYELSMSLAKDERSLTLIYEKFRLFHENDILTYNFIKR